MIIYKNLLLLFLYIICEISFYFLFASSSYPPLRFSSVLVSNKYVQMMMILMVKKIAVKGLVLKGGFLVLNCLE